ncbi:O-antigen ligase family protein [Psychrobacter sp. BI730]|uniref:O-antigen ligase family protein n=1 Tax=Psychrobacter sp. BI730 TaxID=2705463 RepID=UPI0015CEE62B|nr:O-antigen ligase family protein [Psychrobacter sp. BI730]NYR08861.1 O-antigen ligase family protein [Psychrobacter sp. BI730]
MSTIVKRLKNKELFIALYFLLFILGFTIGITPKFYNEFRILQVTLLLNFGLHNIIHKHGYISRAELLFFVYIGIASLFWQNYEFIVIDLLLAYLLYKTFFLLKYNELATKVIVFFSLLIFPLLPLSVFDYISTGTYYPIWHPMPWNIRIYDSYLLIVSIFAVWFYITETKYKKIYLLFLLLAFFSVLLNGGRSATLAYTVFIAVIVVFNRIVRWQILATYAIAWLAYISISYLAISNLSMASPIGLQIARTTTSLRYDLWMNAIECWIQSPLVGCGFYQLYRYENLGAHPHNLLLQILTETGLIGFGFLLAIVVTILKHIDWQLKRSYFVIAALLAIGVDTSLSGTHIYPITQMALLWLLVFLLKNPVFQHAAYFNRVPYITSVTDMVVSIVVYFSLTVIFIYLFLNTSVLFDSLMLATPPRFWEYGYQLF